jgi:hypothetical protein
LLDLTNNWNIPKKNQKRSIKLAIFSSPRKFAIKYINKDKHALASISLEILSKVRSSHIFKNALALSKILTKNSL